MRTLDVFLNFNISTTLSAFAKAMDGHSTNNVVMRIRKCGQVGKMETNILGTRIPFSSAPVFWRDFGFWTQEKFKIKTQNTLSRALYHFPTSVVI